MLVGARGRVRLYDTRIYLNAAHFWPDISRMPGPVAVARFRVHRSKVVDFELLEAAATTAAFRPSSQAAADATRRVLQMFTELAPLGDGDVVTLRAMRETSGYAPPDPPRPGAEGCVTGVLCLSSEDVTGGLDVFKEPGRHPPTHPMELSPGFMAIFPTDARAARTPLAGHGAACRIQLDCECVRV